MRLKQLLCFGEADPFTFYPYMQNQVRTLEHKHEHDAPRKPYHRHRHGDGSPVTRHARHGDGSPARHGDGSSV